MTYVPLASSTLNSSGVDVNAVYTAATATATGYDPAYPNPPFLVGTSVLGNNNSKWMFVSVATSCSKGDFCRTSISFAVTPLVTADAGAAFGQQIGIAMATGTTGQFLWLQTTGENQAANVVAATTAAVPLFTSSTAGRLTSVATNATSYPVYGVQLWTTATAAQTQGTAQMTSIELGTILTTANALGIAF